jgi:hypothetical protein
MTFEQQQLIADEADKWTGEHQSFVFKEGVKWALSQPELLENFAEWIDSNYTQTGNGWGKSEELSIGPEISFKEVFAKYLNI